LVRTISKDSTNVSQTQILNLEGKYFGLINGTNWELFITKMSGSSILGYSICYWNTKTVTANFSGNFDQKSRKLVLNEEQGLGSGKFEGVVSADATYLNGDWWKYSDNTHYSWTLQKGEKSITQNNSSTPGKYPQASDRMLISSDLSNMSLWDLKVMRNEIFARHGFIFKTYEMRDYFNRQSWYQALYDNVDNMLSQTEKSNIELIKQYER